MIRCFSSSVGVKTATTEVKLAWECKCWKCFSITYMILTVSSSVYYFMSYLLYYTLNRRSDRHFPSTADFLPMGIQDLQQKLVAVYGTQSCSFLEASSDWNLATGRAGVPMTWQELIMLGLALCFWFRGACWICNRT